MFFPFSGKWPVGQSISLGSGINLCIFIEKTYGLVRFGGLEENGPWENQFRTRVASIDPKLIEKYALFSVFDLPGQNVARHASLFELSGLLLSFRGIARLGMNRLCGILAISHLGGTVDDDDVTHLDIPLPPPHHAQEKNTS